MQIKEKGVAWLRQLRLHMQPMYFINYSIGSAVAYTTSQRFDLGVYVLGYICLFLGVLCAALINDYYDYPTDCINKNAGFTAGTQILVEGKLGFKEVKVGIFVVLSLIPIFGYLLIRTAGDVSPWSTLFLLSFGTIFAVEYTAPPLKLCYKGIGEVIVATMTGPFPILFGYIPQIGTWTNSLPWLLSIPLFFAMFAAITLGTIPDYQADKTVSKKTISVIFGPRIAALVSLALIAITALSCVLLWYLKILTGPVSITLFVVIPYALILSHAVIKLIKSDDFDRPINNILRVAVFNIMLIGLILLLSLLW
jgi:1,4-dihydroxy-2-naphthoate octaprenyltransferase